MARNLKYLGQREVVLNELWSRGFNCPFTKIPYHPFVEEYLRGVEPEGSGYYHWIMDYVNTRESLWGYIKDERDAVMRAAVFRNLVLSIRDEGLKPFDGEVFKIRGVPFGPIVVAVENTRQMLIDGHHRCAAIYGIGKGTVIAEIYENVPRFFFGRA